MATEVSGNQSMQACIDLGSNSFHLLIGVWKEGRIQIIERCSEKVQLGEGVRSSKNISHQAFQRGIECLERFKLLMAAYPIQQYWALGTNTFRVAENAREFIAEAHRLGIDIAIISGVQEAVLIYAGVITSLPKSDKHRLVIDIGGGSTEVIIGRDHERLLTESLWIGSVSWRDKFFAAEGAGQQVLEARMDAGLQAAHEVFDKVVPGVQKIGWDEAYASSGTVKMLAQICEFHGYGKGQIQLQGLYDLKSKMAKSIAENLDVPGLKERRRDLLLAGWCVMTGLMEAYGVDCINFSATALREGMLDFMVKNEKTIGAMSRTELPEVSSAPG